ncbi:hypothetical protein OVY01_20175 [Robbsia sp. Bb-Pol-6]|uniref:Uncharacterized protein n=1 Tax=Robbsia betulipollinis TaxID=2981849 RepID=A0ABT3ZSQ9_9BURK|nr:hypothetical protein [Robbsia betulipollinis]MCY0389467.1 hypothetical protein [Robbsia betulipollinis]
MKKQFVVATLVALASATASFAAEAQMASPAATTTEVTPPRHHVKRHPIRNRMHKIGRALKAPHAPSAPTEPKP